MELGEVMRTTGAARRFLAKPVDNHTVYQVLDVARFAPSGGNRQPWRVTWVRDPELKRALRDLYVLGWREYAQHVETGLVPFAPGSDGSWHGPAVDLDLARASEHPNEFGDNLEQAPVLLVITVSLPALAVLDNGLGRQSVVGGASIYPFVQNILLAARAQGLVGRLTTVLCRQEPEVRQLLGLPASEGIAALVSLGYPERHVRRLSRRPVEAFATIDRRNGPPLRLAAETTPVSPSAEGTP
jgi:nitroreductase